MRRVLCLLLGLGIATTAVASVRWTVPGWYQVDTIPEGQLLWKGPFDDEASCRASLPENDEADEEAPFFDCEYLGARPDYDV